MRIAARIAGVIGLSVAIALGLSWTAGSKRNDTSPVFQQGKTGRLTEVNMVDALIALPLDLGIAKADFRQSVMSVDLYLPKGVSGERFVYHDLYELSRFAWNATTNVDRLLIRVILQDGEKRQNKELLLAMEAKRTQAVEVGELAAVGTVTEIRMYLESRYHFSYTPEWKDQS